MDSASRVAIMVPSERSFDKLRIGSFDTFGTAQ
jgi:hypothetical protein